MSWASKRKTTRVEDQAYSLMGLFNVNMPMLYGEGKKAFIRLQEEIIKYSADQSIFAWPAMLSDYNAAEIDGVIQGFDGGLLAAAPAAFAFCGNIQWREPAESRQPFSLTNVGLSIELLLRPGQEEGRQDSLFGEEKWMLSAGWIDEEDVNCFVSISLNGREISCPCEQGDL